MDNAHSNILARKLSKFLPLGPEEMNCLAEMQSAPVTVKRGKLLTQEGQTGHKAYVLESGWACSYKDLPNGNRQIISFPIAGDCVGLRSVLLRTADHSFAALTGCGSQSRGGPAYHEMRHRVPASRDGAAMGCVS
jgi:CRP-like cAMP-binding protein